jgi:helix-turn-helix protein
VQQTGIGLALRKVRLLRGKSIEEASRETRIRTDYLHALEQERFDSLMGDVYVRGALRSYSTYLGMDPDKVLAIYNDHFGGPRPTVPDPNPAPVRSPRRAHHDLSHVARHHPSWAFLIGVALLALAVFAAAGVLRSRSAPGGSGVPRVRASIPVLPPKVIVAIRASVPVNAVIRVDGGVAFDGLLRKDEFRSFEGSRSISIMLDRGGVAAVTVNGHSLGNPGLPTSAYSAAFDPRDFRRSPSAGSSAGSPSPGGSPSASSP